jgi:hypothetical protein
LKLMLLLLAPSIFAGAAFEDPQSGYQVEVPAGWRHHYDAAKGVLVLAGGKGLRIRVETKEESHPLGKAGVARWYRSDGKRLQKRSAGFKVLQKPWLSEDNLLGGRPTWEYAFAYKGREGEVFRAQAWLTGVPAQSSGIHLQVRVLAYAGANQIKAQRGPLEAFLASFRWAEQEGKGLSGSKSAGTQIAQVASNQPPEEDPELAAREQERLDKIRSGIEFDNGSLKGGMGVMKSGGLITDPKRLARIRTASRVKSRIRTGKQREHASRYLGFLKK